MPQKLKLHDNKNFQHKKNLMTSLSLDPMFHVRLIPSYLPATMSEGALQEMDCLS